jgi:hypothetical protein
MAALAPFLSTLDQIEVLLARLPQEEMPVKHHFIRDENGKVVMYCRAIYMKGGNRLTSRIHNTQHPYAILCGKANVWAPDTGWKVLQGPCSGITQPGTKRLLEIIEDMIMITYHATNRETVAEVAADILVARPNELLEVPGLAQYHDITKGEMVA